MSLEIYECRSCTYVGTMKTVGDKCPACGKADYRYKSVKTNE